MVKLYAKEQLVHRGVTFFPGQAIECDDNEAASLIASKRCTQSKDVAMAAREERIRREFQPGTRRTGGVVR